MSRAFRILVATALLSVCAFAFSVGGAQAQTHADAATCSFTGLAGTADPDGAGTGVQSVSTDIAVGGPATVATDFDTGNYTFTGPATCVVEDGLHPAANGVQAATINSVGDYNNRICGTGTAESTPGQAGDADADSTTVNFANPAVHDIASVDYQIDFKAGNGELIIDSAVAVAGSGHNHDLSGGGAVHIHPQVGNCGTTDVEQFSVAGSFTVAGP